MRKSVLSLSNCWHHRTERSDRRDRQSCGVARPSCPSIIHRPLFIHNVGSSSLLAHFLVHFGVLHPFPAFSPLPFFLLFLLSSSSAGHRPFFYSSLFTFHPILFFPCPHTATSSCLLSLSFSSFLLDLIPPPSPPSNTQFQNEATQIYPGQTKPKYLTVLHSIFSCTTLFDCSRYHHHPLNPGTSTNPCASLLHGYRNLGRQLSIHSRRIHIDRDPQDRGATVLCPGSGSRNVVNFKSTVDMASKHRRNDASHVQLALYGSIKGSWKPLYLGPFPDKCMVDLQHRRTILE